MKKTLAKLLLLAMILAICSALSGCYLYIGRAWQARNEKFAVAIVGVDQKKTIDFEITKSYRIEIKIFGDVAVNDETQNDIQIEYNEKNANVSFSYHQARNQMVHYRIHLSELGTNDTLKFTYAGETIEVPYNVIDYDFEANDRIKPASLDELDKYPAFKDMLTSIEYYEFKEPYIGLNEWEYDINEKSGDIMFDYSDYEMVNGYMKTDYLRYLTDSVYYPSRYIGYAMYMNLYSDTDINEGASKSKMHYFALYFALDDPHHNKHPDGITSAAFQAYDLASCKFTDSGEPLSSIMMLIERYPDQFYQYRVDDVTIYVLSSKNSGAEAYFIYGDYFYSMSVSYEFD